MRGVDVCEETRMAAAEVAQGAGRYNEGAVLDTKAAVRELRGGVDPPTTLTVGDRRGRVRDASNESGERAMSVDLLPSESTARGLHFQGDVRELNGLGPPGSDLIPSFMPCEQTISLGSRMAVVKALDGRMYWGMVQWLYVWCINTTCMPDMYVVDFYDAPHLVTDLTEWGSEWKTKTLLGAQVARGGISGCGAARPRRRTSVTRRPTAWRRGWLSRCSRMAKAAAPSSRSRSNAWQGAGLPLPRCYYDNAEGRPPGAEERLYATFRGRGDGRRLSHDVAPKSVTEVGGYAPRAASEKAASQHRIWRRSSCAEARTPSVISRRPQLARAACHLRAQEFAEGLPTLDAEAPGDSAIMLLPARKVARVMHFLG
ncbi:MAG: hypothetical protein SGPRY_001693 [Prymnesium sp.]